MYPESIPSVRSIDHEPALEWAALLILLGAAYLAARLATWLGMYVAARPWRRAQEAHWTERARLAWPSRRLGGPSFVMAITSMLIAVNQDDARINILPMTVTTFLFVAATWTGVVQSSLAWGRRLNPAVVSLTPRANRASWLLNLSLGGAPIAVGFLVFGLASQDRNAAVWASIAIGIFAVGVYITWGWRACWCADAGSSGRRQIGCGRLSPRFLIK